MSWFRRTPAPPPPALSLPDALTISAYPELNPERWAALTDRQRALYRQNQTQQGGRTTDPHRKDTP